MADAFSFMTSTFKNISDFQTKNDDNKSNFYVEDDELISYSDNNDNGCSETTNYCDFTTFEEAIMSDAKGNNKADMAELMDYENFEFNDNINKGYDYEEAFNSYVASDSFGNEYQLDDEENTGFDIES
ncbi:TPA: hypothetical protein IAA87_00885 [Candidatus Avigastranaerophilus faecigallinarum]|nr:hypothetical protein [Candidatus Avigastranaerophilus faecigallinarum]